jgi:hypothetical protein
MSFYLSILYAGRNEFKVVKGTIQLDRLVAQAEEVSAKEHLNSAVSESMLG